MKKRVSGDWVSIPYRKYGTDTDVITSFPTNIIGDGTNATAVIKGNMVQSGTPTAASPVYPSECGDRTENLYNNAETVWVNGYIDDNGDIVTGGNQQFTSNFTAVEDETDYNLSGTVGPHRIYYYNTNKEFISRSAGMTASVQNFTTPQDCKFIQIQCPYEYSAADWMLVRGSTAKTFEPYGYKIPISLGNTTASIYITDVIRKIDGITSPIERTTGGTDDISSNGTLTRRIIKVELDGSEGEWRKGGGDGNMAFFVNNAVLNGAAGSPILCSHFSVGNVGATTTDIGIFIGSTGTNLRIRPENVASTELTDFTTWLSNQKTGGTPVTIYYVAATSTTEQITVPTLPTTGAVEQFDVDTTLAPSEVDLTYHGWHNKTDKEYTSGEWQ